MQSFRECARWTRTGWQGVTNVPSSILWRQPQLKSRFDLGSRAGTLATSAPSGTLPRGALFPCSHVPLLWTQRPPFSPLLLQSLSSSRVLSCLASLYFAVTLSSPSLLCFLLARSRPSCSTAGFVCRLRDIFKLRLCLRLVDLEADCSLSESTCCLSLEGSIVRIFTSLCTIPFRRGRNCLLCLVSVLFELESWCFWGLWRGAVGCEVLVAYFYFCLFSVYLFCLVPEYYGEF